jgi:hypothetical protein
MMKDEVLKLFNSYQFDAAVAAYERQLTAGVGDRWANMSGLGNALIAVGRFGEAIPFLFEVGQHEKASLPGSYAYDIEISVCQWLSGQREASMTLMRSLVTGIQDRSLIYSNDMVGGLNQGLLLHYMAVTADSAADRQLSLTYVTKLAQSKKAKHWPGPVGRFLIGEVSFDEALVTGVGVTNLAHAVEIAADDLLKRRRLINLLFNAGVASRVAGDESGCLEYMRRCASLQNPLVEFDWYLAREEASQ